MADIPVLGTSITVSLQNMQQKYAEERDKRIRTQYLSLRSSAAKAFGEDPFVDYEALNTQVPVLKGGDHVKILIVGTGHSGLLFAVRLIHAGFSAEDIRLVDNAGGYGGTWYWNRYPGLMCDVEASVYLPLLEETGYMPKHRYSYGPEIREHSERIAAKWNLKALFATEVKGNVWDEDKGRWVVKMSRNLGPSQEKLDMEVTTQFLIAAPGVFPIPRIPDVPGVNEFVVRNHLFHTARWNYQQTGGSPEAPDLTKLKDKKVGIVGTAATSVQVIPELANWAKHLYVFQRTPAAVDFRGQKPMDAEAWAEIAYKKGWQTERMENFNACITNERVDVDLIDDGWTHTPGFGGLIGSTHKGIVASADAPGHISELYALDADRADKVRARVDEQVTDHETAQNLKAWYPAWCKRPTFNDLYLPTFNRPNVTLVDMDGKGIERLTEQGVVTNDVVHDVDVLILATGFSSSAEGTSPEFRLGAPIIGRNGRSLGEKWSADDFGTLHGVTTHGFPNLFLSSLVQAPGSANLTSVFDAMAKRVANVLAQAVKTGGATEMVRVEATKQAENAWSTEVAKRASWFAAVRTCTPSYFFSGTTPKPESPEAAAVLAKRAGWGEGPNDYLRVLREYDEKNALEGFEVTIQT